jgi:hypothetical protein
MHFVHLCDCTGRIAPVVPEGKMASSSRQWLKHLWQLDILPVNYHFQKQ